MPHAEAAHLGAWGEQRAAEELVRAGLRIIDRNWRCALGEIDIVAIDGTDLVVVEVKTRRSSAKGSALDAVTPAKLARLRVLAVQWLASRPAEPAPQRFRAIRVDVVAIMRPLSGPTVITHLRGVE